MSSLAMPYLYRINARFDNSSALIWVSENGRLDTARYALEHGAAVNTRSQRHNRPQALQVAVENDHVELAEFLLANGAEVNGHDLSQG